MKLLDKIFILALPPLFWYDKTKNLFTPWKHRLIEKSKYRFCCCIVALFQLIVLLKHDFSCCNSFRLPWIGKVTTGT